MRGVGAAEAAEAADGDSGEATFETSELDTGPVAEVSASAISPINAMEEEPEALTGPVRRGDAGAVAKHLETLRRLMPAVVPFYLAAARIQLPLSRALGEAPAESFDAIEALLSRES